MRLDHDYDFSISSCLSKLGVLTFVFRVEMEHTEKLQISQEKLGPSMFLPLKCIFVSAGSLEDGKGQMDWFLGTTTSVRCGQSRTREWT